MENKCTICGKTTRKAITTINTANILEDNQGNAVITTNIAALPILLPLGCGTCGMKSEAGTSHIEALDA